jgi:hypothetical protein
MGMSQKEIQMRNVVYIYEEFGLEEKFKTDVDLLRHQHDTIRNLGNALKEDLDSISFLCGLFNQHVIDNKNKIYTSDFTKLTHAIDRIARAEYSCWLTISE